MQILRQIMWVAAALLLSACASTGFTPEVEPFEAFEKLSDRTVVDDQQSFIKHLYAARTWVPYKYLSVDPIEFSQRSAAPVNSARTKIIGPSYQDSLHSLAAKLWMIEHAEHTLDLTYYIFKYDPAGYAILGALCNAVQRGVDVRIMVDSLGSLNMGHEPLRALETCADDAGYIRDTDGRKTPYRARIQAVIINAITSISSWSNRRSHDKLIIKDGSFPGKDMMITGGRNISVDYYGISKDGSRNPDTYLDLEILLRSSQTAGESRGALTASDVSSAYYTLLFLHKGNLPIHPVLDEHDDHDFGLGNRYAAYRRRAQEALSFMLNLPAIENIYAAMPSYLAQDYNVSEVRLAHELGNLVSQDVTTNVMNIKSRNLNSIGAILANVIETSSNKGTIDANFRIVSPYLFIAEYKDKEGKVIYDGANKMLTALEEHPELSFEIITNSVLTSDNFFTQSVIDMDTVPRLLLTPEKRDTWLESAEISESNPKFINSEEWRRLINHPRIKIYQTGKLDSVLIGGDEHYGKLHAKFFFDERFGFVGTSNFDYRSRLYNNEMGFFYLDPELSSRLNEAFDELKDISLLWGSPEWLEMRKRLVEAGGSKGATAKTQRGLYKFMKGTGLIWFF